VGVDAEHGKVVAAPAGWPDERFRAVLGSRLPIVQAPMAGAGGVELAVAAMAGGAVGSLPCALLKPEQVRAQAAEVRARAEGPLNLNFFCHQMPPAPDEGEWLALLRPFYDRFGLEPAAGEGPGRAPFDAAMAEAIEAVRPEIVSFHFGLPDGSLLDRVRAAGARVIATATTVREARSLARRRVDAIIAQGWEAGGHAGSFLSPPEEQLGLIALVPQVADATDLPVIAAGGIADGRGVAAALTLGAAAVQVGTAYLFCPESLVAPAHRAALASERAERTVFTNLFTGRRARGLATPPVDELGPVRPEAPAFPHAGAALAPLAAAARERGEEGFVPMWSGQAAPLARAEPAAGLTKRLAREALALLGAKA
jgi:nitronate monooxygenase